MDFPEDISRLSNLMDSFRLIMTRLDGIERWGEFPNRNFRQTSFQHSFFIGLLTAYLCKREKEIGTHQFDSSRLIVHALIHDFSEGVTGDLTFRFKNDPRLKILHDVVEHEQTITQIRQLAPLSKFLEDAFNLQPDSLEAKFFNAIEYLDYFLYALSEYVLHDTRIFAVVIFRHHEKLAGFAKQFPSIREIYTPAVHKCIKQIVEKEKQLIAGREVQQPDVAHLNDMIKAMAHLMDQLSDGSSDKKEEMVQLVLESITNYE